MKLPAGFDAEVWAATEQIPAGRVATYGQIARLVGMPGPAPATWAGRWPGPRRECPATGW